MSRRFLVLHGWENRRPHEHWQYWLTERLRSRGEQVLYPQLPRPDEPRLDEWLELLDAELAMLGRGERVVLCHSLACLLWLRHAGLTGPADATAAARSARRPPDLVCTPDDPFCPGGTADELTDLGARVHVVEGAGHISVDEGFGSWPAGEGWALHGSFAIEPAGALAA